MYIVFNIVIMYWPTLLLFAVWNSELKWTAEKTLCEKKIFILWFCNIRAVKKKISIFDMYIPCEASSWTLLHQNRKLSSRISLQNQLFCLYRLPAVLEVLDKIDETVRRVHEDASQGMYMSKIEIFFFTARILQNQRMLCCGKCFHD
jgi:hypothetical protein